jgi:hypothetical protein
MMLKIKIFILKFMLFVQEQYIQEDWEIITPLGQVFLYPAWFIRATLIWLISPLFLPQYVLMNTKNYKALMEMQTTMSPEQIKEFNKVATRNFLVNKGVGKKNLQIRKRK